MAMANRALRFDEIGDDLVTPTSATVVNFDLFFGGEAPKNSIFSSEDDEMKENNSDNENFTPIMSEKTKTPNNNKMDTSITLNDSTISINRDLTFKCSLEDSSEDDDSDYANNLKRKRNIFRSPLQELDVNSFSSNNNSTNSSTFARSPIKKKLKKVSVINLDNQRKNQKVVHVFASNRGNNVENSFISLEDALNNVNPYDTIILHEGRYFLDKQLVVNVQGILIQGVSKDKVTIQTNINDSLFIITANYVTLSQLTIYHEYGGLGNSVCSPYLKRKEEKKFKTNSALVVVECSKTIDLFQTQIDNCDIGFSFEHGVKIQGHAHPTITNSTIHHCRKLGILFSHNASGLVKENKIYNNGYEGITLRGHAHPVIKRNKIFDGLSGGIYIRDNSHPHLHENEIYGNKLSAICVSDESRVLIKGNSIHHGKQNGIHIKDSSTGVIEENTIFCNELPNIYITDKCVVEVKNNEIYGSENTGIYVKGTADCRPKLLGNNIYNNKRNNILIQGNAKPIIKKNNIYLKNFNTSEQVKGISIKDFSIPHLEENNVYGHTLANIDVSGRAAPIVTNCSFSTSFTNGVLVRDYASPSFDNCKIFENQHPNVLTVDTSDPKFIKCLIYDGKQTGISVKGNSQPCIEKCEIYGNSFTGIKASCNSNPKIINNKIFNGGQSGIWVKDNAKGFISKNRVFGNRKNNIFMEIGCLANLEDNTFE
ncbi:hypothetical protein ABK040_015609 [Willaertia magna]